MPATLFREQSAITYMLRLRNENVNVICIFVPVRHVLRTISSTSSHSRQQKNAHDVRVCTCPHEERRNVEWEWERIKVSDRHYTLWPLSLILVPKTLVPLKTTAEILWQRELYYIRA